MPYILNFSKQVEIADPNQYINDCCIGGNVVLNRLLPVLRSYYGIDLQSNQEDWGWLAWFKTGSIKLSIDIFTEDYENLQFQVLLTSHRPRLILSDTVEDSAELELLQKLVIRELTDWNVTGLTVQQVNKNYCPIS